jgi:hypothetical protein
VSRWVRDRDEYESGSKWFADWHRSQPDDSAGMIDLDGVGYCRTCYQALYLVEAARSKSRKKAPVTERLGAQHICPRCDDHFGGIEVFVFYKDNKRPDEIYVDHRSAGLNLGWLANDKAWQVLQSVRRTHICTTKDRRIA